LTIDFALIDESVCAAFLQFPRILDSFTYTYSGQTNRVNRIENDELVAALVAQRQSLRKLSIRGCADGRAVEVEPEETIGSLYDFPVLEELAIPILLIIFDENGNLRHDPLPPSLARLQLYVYDDLPIGHVAEFLEELLSNMEIRAPMLSYVWIEYWLKASEDDSNAQLLEIRALEDRFKRAGVQLEVYVDPVSQSDTIAWEKTQRIS
jgi:hypothetical protein